MHHFKCHHFLYSATAQLQISACLLNSTSMSEEFWILYSIQNLGFFFVFFLWPPFFRNFSWSVASLCLSIPITNEINHIFITNHTWKPIWSSQSHNSNTSYQMKGTIFVGWSRPIGYDLQIEVLCSLLTHDSIQGCLECWGLYSLLCVTHNFSYHIQLLLCWSYCLLVMCRCSRNT